MSVARIVDSSGVFIKGEGSLFSDAAAGRSLQTSLSAHHFFFAEPRFGSLTPVLEFDDVPFRIRHVVQCQGPGARDFDRLDFAVVRAAAIDDFVPLGVDVLYLKSEMREAGLVDFRRRTINIFVVLKNLERRPVFAMPGQAKVDAADRRPRNVRQSRDKRPFVIALGPDRFAIEDFDVKIGQRAPIASDDVGVGVANSFALFDFHARNDGAKLRGRKRVVRQLPRQDKNSKRVL